MNRIKRSSPSLAPACRVRCTAPYWSFSTMMMTSSVSALPQRGVGGEYNSSPNYFDSSAEEEFRPEGGDAQKLCTAFGSSAVAKVKKILGKSSHDDDGYIFAVERHADLADALGIPSYGVGTAFRQISEEELPEGLDRNDLVMTKDLAAPQPTSQSLDSVEHKPVAGYYKVSFRAHPQRTRSIPIGWTPNLWADLACAEQDLSGKLSSGDSPAS